MAFDLGTIRARMGLDPSGFVSGLKSAETAAGIFGPRIVELVNNPLLGTIRVVKEAGAAFAGMVVDTAQQNRALDEWAQRLGISTIVLSALSAEANRHNIEMEDVADTIGELAVKARDGVSGSEDLLNTFKKLGVSVTGQNGELRDLEGILLDVARGLANTMNATERFAIADELASDGAKRLLPVLIALGEQGYAPIIRRAERLGYVLDKEAAAASTKLAGTLGDLNLAVEGVKRSLSTDFITGFARSLGDADETIQSTAESLNLRLKPAMTDLGETTGTVLTSIADGIKGISAANGSDAGGVFGQMIEGAKTLNELLAPVVESLRFISEINWTPIAHLIEGNVPWNSVSREDQLQSFILRQSELGAQGQRTVVNWADPATVEAIERMSEMHRAAIEESARREARAMGE